MSSTPLLALDSIPYFSSAACGVVQLRRDTKSPAINPHPAKQRHDHLHSNKKRALNLQNLGPDFKKITVLCCAGSRALFNLQNTRNHTCIASSSPLFEHASLSTANTHLLFYMSIFILVFLTFSLVRTHFPLFRPLFTRFSTRNRLVFL